MRLIAGCLAAIGLAVTAHAAEITTRVLKDATVINIVGPIVKGDADRFNQVAASLTGMIGVALNSHGGVVVDGLNIGQAIHERGYDTMVLNGATCASTCGLIWLAGSQRFVGSDGRIGFHAAFRRNDGDGEVEESGVANALIGAYLSKLGLSYDAIFYLTNKAPTDIQWLNAADAQRLGIQYAVLPDAPTPKPAAPATDAPYTIAAWLANGGTTVTISPDQQAALATPGYSAGRQDRINYEQWYASLPEGAYRDGATYWAGNRSLKQPPSCTPAGSLPAWQAGCIEARGRLAPIDVRRHAEKDYWFGWNSL